MIARVADLDMAAFCYPCTIELCKPRDERGRGDITNWQFASFFMRSACNFLRFLVDGVQCLCVGLLVSQSVSAGIC